MMIISFSHFSFMLNKITKVFKTFVIFNSNYQFSNHTETVFLFLFLRNGSWCSSGFCWAFDVLWFAKPQAAEEAVNLTAAREWLNTRDVDLQSVLARVGVRGIR